jgi:hypothetical protein
MALVFRGKTTCMICGEVLQQDDDIGATTAFIADKSDPLWRYSDAAFHRSCFSSWPLRQEFEAIYAAALEETKVTRIEEI